MVEQIAPGVKVLPISVVTGDGLDQLDEFLQPGKTIALLGSSGIGKSSLVNAILGEELMKVSGIREEDSRGRHTTTHRQLIFLKNDAMMIDTPGMRELGMWDNEEGVMETFSDIEEIMEQCKFSNCTHTNEQGCAILQGIEQGTLEVKRYLSYQKLMREVKFSAKKAQMIKSREKHTNRRNFSDRKDGRKISKSYQHEVD